MDQTRRVGFPSRRSRARGAALAVSWLILASMSVRPVRCEGAGLELGSWSWLPKDLRQDAPATMALRRLLEGNERYVAGKASHPDQTLSRRTELTQGQHPFAVVLTCSDSRVAPELFFDQGLGDLFVIRNAGNVLDDHVLGSIEYAVEHLHVALILVVGHEKCGAVSAAVAGGEAPGHIRSIVEAIAPALKKAKGLAGDAVDNTVRCNAQLCADALAHSEPLLQEAHHAHRLVVAPARYDLASGRVQLLP